MIRETMEQIMNGTDLRQNLIQLKEELREDKKTESHNREALLYFLGGNHNFFADLLYNEDAKVRKNTALIMGELGEPEYLSLLYSAYQREKQLFVKSSYLEAMEEFDYREYLPEFEKRIEEIGNEKITEENKKHITEELRQLTKMVHTMKGIQSHEFTGYHVLSELVLLTNRNHIHVTMDELKNIPRKEFSAGVMLKTKELDRVMQVRTFQEMLFVLPEVKSVPKEINEAAKMILQGGLLEFLEKRHNGQPPFYFRIELKSRQMDNKGSYVKKLGMEIQQQSGQQLINTATNYELELRLIENNEGRFNLLIKLFTLQDERFLYRKDVIAASIKPVNAALTMALARPYLKEGAQVLDPFCGVGTMLLERDALVEAGSMYGLDIFGEAIEKARNNSARAKRVINYINRDFFDFHHEYLFDEIITNMPSVRNKANEKELYSLYVRFFDKAGKHLKEGGILVLYTHNRDYVKKLGNSKGYHIKCEFEISMMEETYVFVIQYM